MASEGIFIRLRRYAGWWSFAGGGAVIIVAICVSLFTCWFLIRATKANGTIVDLAAATDDDGDTNYAPVFSFTAADGRVYTITSGTATNPPAFEIGDHVSVLYDAANPTHARLRTTGQLWMFSFIAGPIGLFYVLLGTVLLYFDRRHRRRFIISST